MFLAKLGASSSFVLPLLHGVGIYFSISVQVRARQWYEYTVDLSSDSEGRLELERV
jgi:hypothetical protein